MCDLSLPPTLLQRSGGRISTSAALSKKKLIGLFFSSKCEACDTFLPHLTEFYENIIEEDHHVLEIVFVSVDDDEAVFLEQRKRMPWPAVNFQEIKSLSLHTKYSVENVPTLVILNADDGTIVDSNGAFVVAMAHNVPRYAMAKWGLFKTPDLISGDIVREINSLRLSERKYTDSILNVTGKRIQFRTQERKRSVEETMLSLWKLVTSPLRPVMISHDLDEAAAEHLQDLAQSGSTSHTGSDGSSVLDRVCRHCNVRTDIPLQPTEFVVIGTECCKAADVVLNILEQLVASENSGAGYNQAEGTIDPRLRWNMLNGNLAYIGAAVGPHPTHGICCVVIFSGDGLMSNAQVAAQLLCSPPANTLLPGSPRSGRAGGAANGDNDAGTDTAAATESTATATPNGSLQDSQHSQNSSLQDTNGSHGASRKRRSLQPAEHINISPAEATDETVSPSGIHRYKMDVSALVKPCSSRIVREINLLRSHPADYGDMILAERLPRFTSEEVYTLSTGERVRTEEGKALVLATAAYLQQLAPVDKVVMVSSFLEDAALDHVRDLAVNSRTGHTGSDGSSVTDRISRHCSVRWVTHAENITYGNDSYMARDAVIDLLIDDGVPSRGHRLNLLNPELTSVGAARGPHPNYGYCCVMDMSAAGLLDTEKAIHYNTSLHLKSPAHLASYEAGEEDDKLMKLVRSIFYQGDLISETRGVLERGAEVLIEYRHTDRTAKISHIHPGGTSIRTLTWEINN